MLLKRTNVDIITTNKETGLVTVEQLHNTVTKWGLDLIVNALAGNAGYNPITIGYIAVGSGGSSGSYWRDTLQAETFRKVPSTLARIGIGQVRCTCSIDLEEAVGQWEEIGWFAGPYATASADTGEIISRILYSHNKTNLETILIQRTDTFFEGSESLWERASDETVMFPTSPTTLTISATGSITITDTAHILRGYNNLDDTLNEIVTPEGFEGNVLLLERGGSEIITAAKELIQRGVNFTFNSNNDQLLLRCSAPNTFKVLSEFSAGS